MKSTCITKAVAVGLYQEEACRSDEKIGTVYLPDFVVMPKALVVGEDIYIAAKHYYGDPKYWRAEPIHVVDPGEVVFVKGETAEGGAN